MSKTTIAILSIVICSLVLTAVITKHQKNHARNMRYLSVIFGANLPPSLKVQKADVLITHFLPMPEVGRRSEFWIECKRDDFLVLLNSKNANRAYWYDYGKGLTDKLDSTAIPKNIQIVRVPQDKSAKAYANSLRAYITISDREAETITADVYIDSDIAQWHLERWNEGPAEK